jgi:hypothetical protein
MYKFLFFALIIVACNDKPSSKTGQSATQSEAGVHNGYADWSVNPGIAIAMVKSAHDSMCNRFQIVDSNNIVRTQIDSVYSSDKYSKTWVNARFLPGADEAKYRSLRGMPPGSPKGNIRGYCTKLYVVKLLTLSSGSTTEELYFDIITVCPPPPDCNGDSTKNLTQ